MVERMLVTILKDKTLNSQQPRTKNVCDIAGCDCCWAGITFQTWNLFVRLSSIFWGA